MIYSRFGRRATRWVVLAAIMVAPVFQAAADVPTRYEQFIYSVVAYNGKDYSGTFVREPSDTLYLIGNTDNFVSARDTFVYYWAITGNYRLDTDTINHQFDGKLRVQGNGISKTLTMQKYTYFNLRGEYELNWKVAKGAAAEKVYSDYQKAVSAYQQKVYDYQQAQINYQQKLNNLAAQISKLRNQGVDPTRLMDELKSLKNPQPPAQPSTYAVPPAQIQEAFIINLPAGTYHIEFINPDGTVMQGSRKRLVVFNAERYENVGYDVIPGDKWTRPESSGLPGSVLYVNGTTDLYLRPYFEKQYNDLYHGKLVDNDGRGNPNMTSWVKLQQVPNAKIVLRDRGQSKTVEQESFGVQQIQGASLGYKIIPWSQFQHQSGDKPDIIAYHVPIGTSDRVIRVSTLDEHGTRLRGTDRQIRIIDGSRSQVLLLILSLIPIAAGAVVIGLRSRRYSA